MPANDNAFIQDLSGKMFAEQMSKKPGSVFVNKEATIIGGECAGITGMVVGANRLQNQVEIALKDNTLITTTYENIRQER